MTEEEWMAATHPYKLIYHPKCRSDRKRRLFACACARRVLSFLLDARFAEAVDGCEQFADGVLDWKCVLALRKAVRLATDDLRKSNGLEHQNHAAGSVAALTAKEFMSFKMATAGASHAIGAISRPAFMEGCAAEEFQQVLLARDIFGNPFRPITLDPSWLTSTVTTLARTMYDTRDFSAMPILADAIQDAGCDDETILTHCRGPGPHVRGCFLIDLLTGRE